MPTFSVAIITRNMLTAIGLQHLLRQMMPTLDVRCFLSWGSMSDDESRRCAHFFVDAAMAAESPDTVQRLGHRVILLADTPADTASPRHADMGMPIPMLHVSQPRPQLLQSLLALLKKGHLHSRNLPTHMAADTADTMLTPREKEVLTCVVKGFINKEIAEALHISQTTVITHRKNITEKLHIKSVAGLTLYAVLNELVDPQAVLAR